AIDTLRAHVELQTRQQELIVVRNDYAKQKLALARAIGLPTGQEFTLTEKVPYAPLAALGLEESLQRAYASRSDYQAALQQVRSAEHFRNAATAEHFPSLGFAANYGDLGVTDNLEVVQAQESVAAANENYISSLYAHNLAKIELARAIGYAEEGVKKYLQGK